MRTAVPSEPRMLADGIVECQTRYARLFAVLSAADLGKLSIMSKNNQPEEGDWILGQA